MLRPRVLVTSAAGHTGAPVAKELLAKGFAVRAFVRREDARSNALKEVGAELFVGNLFDYRDLRAAMRGVQRAYHCPPFGPNLLQANVLFAAAAEEARLEMVAVMSAWNAHHAHPSSFTRDQWMSQQFLHWMPSVDVVQIAPGLFAFPYFLDVQTIRNLGLLLLPLGNALNAPPSNEDIAAVVTAVVAKPDEHIGRFYRPTGPQLLSPQDVADICSRVLGRKVRYRDVSTRMFTKAATALGLSAFEISNMRHFVEEHRGGAFAIGAPTDHVEQVTGRAAEEFEVTARRYLENPALVHRSFKVGGKLGAIGMLLKTTLTRTPDLDAFDRRVLMPHIAGTELPQESSEWKTGVARFDHSQVTEPDLPLSGYAQTQQQNTANTFPTASFLTEH